MSGVEIVALIGVVVGIVKEVQNLIAKVKDLKDKKDAVIERINKYRPKAIRAKQLPIMHRSAMYVGILSQFKEELTETAYCPQAKLFLEEDIKMFEGLRDDLSTIEKRNTWWQNWLHGHSGKLDDITTQLQNHTSDLILLLSNVTAGKQKEIFGFLQKVKSIDAREFWVHHFGLVGRVPLDEFVDAFEEYVCNVFLINHLHPKYLVSLGKIIDVRVTGEKPDRIVTVKEYQTFLDSWGPLPFVFDKLFAVMDGDGDLQPWFTTKDKRDAVLDNLGYAVWKHDGGPGQFRARSKSGPKSPITICNDYSGINNSGKVLYGYYANHAPIVKVEGEEKKAVHATLAECLKAYLGVDITVAPLRLDPREPEFSPPTESLRVLGPAPVDQKLVQLKDRADDLLATISEQHQEFASMPVRSSELGKWISAAEALTKMYDSILTQFDPTTLTNATVTISAILPASSPPPATPSTIGSSVKESEDNDTKSVIASLNGVEMAENFHV